MRGRLLRRDVPENTLTGCLGTQTEIEMTTDTYEIYAVRYAHHDRRAAENFYGGDPHDGPMPLDYFV